MESAMHAGNFESTVYGERESRNTDKAGYEKPHIKIKSLEQEFSEGF